MVFLKENLTNIIDGKYNKGETACEENNHLSLCMLGICSSCFFQKYYFRNTIMCQHFRSRYGLTHSVSPDLGPNFLQKLSADDKSDRPLARKKLITS